MAARLLVKPTPRAASEIRRASAWWRANRPAAPFALADDLERAFELIAVQPGIGARARNAKKEGVRRLLLSRTGYHLYYQVNAEAGRVQYLSIRYTQRLAEAGIEASVGSVGDSYDNALAETIHGLYKTEVIARQGPWRSLEQVEFATLAWVHWFNHRRLLGSIGHIPPVELERAYYEREASRRTLEVN